MTTFDKIVWEVVKDERDRTMVVDNHHAYAIIKDRLDSLWEHIRLQSEDDDQEMVLGGLAALAATAQLCAENLALVKEQHGVDETQTIAEQEAAEAKRILVGLFSFLHNNKMPDKSLQRGTTRYRLEFDEHQLASWRQEVQELVE